ncbi:MAG: glycosyltransferase, partial [Muribaculaceae bacterium]|nr:glycosyltransferase [Muribaculaceae bacterium]
MSSHTNRIKVSVTVPIYNTARYLRKCLDSLAAQTLQEIEFILVYDGSTD